MYGGWSPFHRMEMEWGWRWYEMGSERGRGRAHRALEVDGRSTSLDLLECGELKWMWASCCLLPPQAGYPAPGCCLAVELQENC